MAEKCLKCSESLTIREMHTIITLKFHIVVDSIAKIKQMTIDPGSSWVHDGSANWHSTYGNHVEGPQNAASFVIWHSLHVQYWKVLNINPFIFLQLTLVQLNITLRFQKWAALIEEKWTTLGERSLLKNHAFTILLVGILLVIHFQSAKHFQNVLINNLWEM